MKNKQHQRLGAVGITFGLMKDVQALHSFFRTHMWQASGSSNLVRAPLSCHYFLLDPRVFI